MKLFGTIVYPKNRYLTLQFSRGGKNVMCEDYFDNMIVFSDAWWIGKEEENPDEVQLDFPKDLSEGQQLEYEFKGGAGEASVNKQVFPKMEMQDFKEQSPETESEDEFSDVEKKLKEKMEVTPIRHSERTSGKKFRFAEVSSEDDPDGSDADTSEEKGKKTDEPNHIVLDIDHDAAAEKNDSPQTYSIIYTFSE
ncbi:DNA-binding RHL1-like protein [Melia azedarach]|uniref:DNA-binding RHL1-like protein n=1 Tax=Melia azedarach TaxID=155640 RepID=A0ACC1XS08_MELAZ|nr:DNA-binding RHL1-like protein [Melia azedarach]